VIDASDPFEIVAESAQVDERTLVLASGDSFAVFDRHGEIQAGPESRQGIYAGGTRFLSGLALRIGSHRMLLLSSGICGDTQGLFVHEANPDVRGNGMRLPRDLVHIVRRITVVDGIWDVDLTLRSYADREIVLPIDLWFEADFKDVFEVRGSHRARRGTPLAPVVSPEGIELSYTGLDRVTRVTRIETTTAPDAVQDRYLRVALDLKPRACANTRVRFTCELREPGRTKARSPGQFAQVGASQPALDLDARVVTSSPAMNAWIRRSSADLEMLTATTPHGPLPYAGVPWFSTPFGRDALITAYQVLWLDPSLARGVLGFLAAHQSCVEDAARDAEPGKIVHEMRSGEMAALGEVPFARYYGSVDATPLFVWLAAAYHERTADDAFLETLWPNIERALTWIDGPGDPDGDGFVEYAGRSPRGLANQGWKDSRDSVSHADGSLAEGPIALCEVQAYVYGAKRGIARVARRLGRDARAETLDAEADRLRDAFARSFWCDELGTYALALDGRKRPCCVRSSNAGHVLLTGLAPPDQAAIVERTLLASDHFSGWGVRTLAASAVRYNPMAYHNGSIWPHDNGLVAAGLARCGSTRGAAMIFAALFDACRALDDARLPELMCGFDRRSGEPPTLYPVACSPQAWSAGAVFLLLQSALGLTIEAEARQIRIAHPRLPGPVDQVSLHGLRVGDAEVDLLLERSGAGLDLRVLRRSGTLDVVLAS
jgi:glycogen debranching enzyme